MNHWLILLGHEKPPPATHGRKVRPLDEVQKSRPLDEVQKSRPTGRPPHRARLIHPDGSIQEFASMAELARYIDITPTVAGYMAMDGLPDAKGRRTEWIGEPPENNSAIRPVKVIHANGRTHTYPSAADAAKSTGIRLITLFTKISKGSRDAKGRRYQYAD